VFVSGELYDLLTRSWHFKKEDTIFRNSKAVIFKATIVVQGDTKRKRTELTFSYLCTVLASGSCTNNILAHVSKMDRTSPLHVHGAYGPGLGDDPPCVDDAGNPPEKPESNVYPNICTAPALLEEYGQGRDEYGQKV